jgi:hypothetical protein
MAANMILDGTGLIMIRFIGSLSFFVLLGDFPRQDGNLENVLQN